jgi:hypothetical protein
VGGQQLGKMIVIILCPPVRQVMLFEISCSLPVWRYVVRAYRKNTDQQNDQSGQRILQINRRIPFTVLRIKL